jgi:predicted nucleic acid-binding protein
VIVVDSSFLVAYHNTRDVHHEASVGAMGRLVAGEWGRPLLLEYVVLEVATVLLARRDLETAARVSTALLEARELEFVPCSNIFLDTLETFRLQGERGWSFTDAAIVTVARASEDAHVATFDGGFQGVAGVLVVPASG